MKPRCSQSEAIKRPRAASNQELNNYSRHVRCLQPCSHCVERCNTFAIVRAPEPRLQLVESTKGATERTISRTNYLHLLTRVPASCSLAATDIIERMTNNTPSSKAHQRTTFKLHHAVFSLLLLIHQQHNLTRLLIATNGKNFQEIQRSQGLNKYRTVQLTC